MNSWHNYSNFFPSCFVKVSLEMRGENNQRVSDVMQSLLTRKSYPCDVQLLPLDTPHQ